MESHQHGDISAQNWSDEQFAAWKTFIR